jgi:tetratricopeptide (TPR) repeat protein
MQIGRFIEQYYFDRIEELYGELAFHYQNGGDLRKALEYTVKAGERSEELFANQEAIHCYDRAIEQISGARENEADQRLYLHLMEKKADILDLIGEYPGAIEVYREIIGNLRDLDRPGEDIARVLGKQGVVHEKVGEADLAIERIKEGMELLGEEDREERARLLGSMADIFLRDGRLNESIEYCMEGLRSLEEDEETAVGAQINMAAGRTYLEMGQIRKAKRHMNRGIEIFESLGRIKELGRAYLSLGRLHDSKRNYGKAEELYTKSLDIAEKTGNISLLLACHDNLGMTARGKGNLKQAVKHWENGLALAEKTEQHRSIANLKSNLGNAYREIGHISLALDHLEASLRLFERLRSRLDILRVNRGLAILYMTIGHQQQAEKIIRINRVGADREESFIESAMNLDVLARIYKESGCFEKSEPLFEEAREGFRQGSDPDDLATGLLNSVEMYIDWGKADAAQSLLDQAREVVNKFGSKKLIGIFNHLQGRLIHLQGGDLERAATVLKKAVRSFQSLDLPLYQLAAHHALGLVFQDLGKSRRAHQEFLHAAEIIDLLQRKIQRPDLLRRFRERPIVKNILSKASNQYFS